MSVTEADAALQQQVARLKNKFESEGQHLSCRLDGLINARDLKYWDYVCLDVLVNLQQPRTDFPDEMVFILYHQVTELYFKMILWEMDQLTGPAPVDEAQFLDKINRIARYYEQLVSSFDIMVDGMSQEQFYCFRTALFPASGFQSVQYRLIELGSTDLTNLVALKYRDAVSAGDPTDELYDKLYWKQGAMEVGTARKDLSLIHFENKYDHLCRQKAALYADRNLWHLSRQYLQHASRREDLVAALRNLDRLANVEWALSHYRAAVRHLQRNAGEAPATGGTNWREYLPPRYQRVMFFPGLWSEAEKQHWGKGFLKG